eukprot:TRINITY_DN712_c7_g1_i1.p1 TRINITY_DN712_c7_g1~~TRINITY_DN712_c7_g1_i1.p1  ORF type:complete len:112 (+),score=3.55 TRINITY_DN712_c7_g1_i1:1528-1863(+)
MYLQEKTCIFFFFPPPVRFFSSFLFICRVRFFVSSPTRYIFLVVQKALVPRLVSTAPAMVEKSGNDLPLEASNEADEETQQQHQRQQKRKKKRNPFFCPSKIKNESLSERL